MSGEKMNEKIRLYIEKIKEFWKNRTMAQKAVMIGAPLALLVLIIVVSVVSSRPNLVPLYQNLSLQETGQITETLNARGIKYEVVENGTAILVPESMANQLLVELAAEGIPNSGNIDYSFFGQNTGFGMTDNEFNVIKLDAMQTELANLIKGIEGVNDARVMITLPEQSIWVGQDEKEAQASIVINQKPGYTFDQQQIDGLFHLISKSVPNLPTDNIVIMNQMFERFEMSNGENNFSVGQTFATQYEIKKEIEKDIQKQVQQLLATMLGPEKVVVSVTADLDFTQEQRTEERYEPVNAEDMEGITRSAERITETFTGSGQAPGGVVGTGEPDIPNMAEVEGANGEYERIEERINNEVDKIYKEIVESPYKVRNLGIQVAVDPTVDYIENENGVLEPLLLDEAEQEVLRTNIENMLNGIIQTTISGNEPVDNVNERISITMQPFNGRTIIEEPATTIPTWVYFVGGALLLIIIAMIILIVRRNRQKAEEEFEEILANEEPIIEDYEEIETESSAKRKQLEKLAKEKPDEFAKLLRTWLTEE